MPAPPTYEEWTKARATLAARQKAEEDQDGLALAEVKEDDGPEPEPEWRNASPETLARYQEVKRRLGK